MTARHTFLFCIISMIFLSFFRALMIKLELDKLLEERGITRYELAKRTDTHYQIIDGYYKK